MCHQEDVHRQTPTDPDRPLYLGLLLEEPVKQPIPNLGYFWKTNNQSSILFSYIWSSMWIRNTLFQLVPRTPKVPDGTRTSLFIRMTPDAVQRACEFRQKN